MSEEGQIFKKYRLIAEIGRGGMADVFLAVAQGPVGFNKLVVVKKARTELTQDPEFLSMFLDEARLAARLSHPNVVHTTEIGQDGARYFIAMEYLEGQPMNRLRSRLGKDFTPTMQARVLAEALAGLHYAHELCDFDGTPLMVVHRDATPQNVFVTYDGQVKVVDFGIAKAVDSSSDTRTGVVKGKVSYMPPEQATGQRVDRRADIYAAGVMLWEAVAGRRMWKGIADITVILELSQGRIPAITDVVPDVPLPLARIIDKALAPKREDRYETAEDMQRDIEAYLASVPDALTTREIGKFITERFAEDRAKVKSIVETQLRDVRWSGTHPRVTAENLPKIDPGQLVLTPTGAKTVASAGTGEPSSPSIKTPSLLTAAPVTSAEAPAPSPKPNKPIVPIAVAAVAAIGVLIVGVRLFLPSSQPAPTVSAATGAERSPAPKGTSTTTVTPEQGSVKLVIRVTPGDAKILLDGVLLSAGSFEGKVVKVDGAKRVRVEAPGYLAKEETIALSGDVMMSISLERDAKAKDKEPQAAAPAVGPRPQRPSDPVTPPAATPAPPPQAPLAPGQKPKRTIDSDSPYAQ